MNNYQIFRKIQERDNIIKKYSNDTKEDLIDLVIEKDNIIENLQFKIDNLNLFKMFLQERLLELKDNIERGVNDFDARDECEYILDKFTYFLKEDK